MKKEAESPMHPLKFYTIVVLTFASPPAYCFLCCKFRILMIVSMIAALSMVGFFMLFTAIAEIGLRIEDKRKGSHK